MLRRWSIGVTAVVLVALLVMPAAMADQGGSDLPFRASLAGEVSWSFPGTSPSGCANVTTHTQATGQATHLGRVAAIWSHCPAQPGYVLDGRMILVAANGDELYGVYDYDPTSESNRIPVTLTGGTGRFADATGLVVATYNIIPQLLAGCDDPSDFGCLDFSVAWPWWATLRGNIDG